jgi:poly(3-hydroxybutyrate) depolymerase
MKARSRVLACLFWLGCQAPNEPLRDATVALPAPFDAATTVADDAGASAFDAAAQLPEASAPYASAAAEPLDAAESGARDTSLDEAQSPADASSDAAEDAYVPAPVASGCVRDVSAGQHELSCQDLTQLVYVPARCLSQRCGLVIDVHGGTMSARMEEKNTRMTTLGERYGYIVLQPNANLGLFDASVDDDKVLAFAKELISVFHLDQDRVHMMGFSQGGYMTWRFLCAHGDFLASAAPASAAGEANISLEVDCSFTGSDVPSVERDILYMHGTQDALVDFKNAQKKRADVITALALAQTAELSNDAKYRRTRYQNQRGTVFEFIEHDYTSPSAFPAQPPLGIAIVGHCYPGSSDLEITEDGQLMAFGCTPPTAFNWGETVMEFFRAHPRTKRAQ